VAHGLAKAKYRHNSKLLSSEATVSFSADFSGHYARNFTKFFIRHEGNVEEPVELSCQLGELPRKRGAAPDVPIACSSVSGSGGEERMHRKGLTRMAD
jgi:hypothetical protein